MKVWRTFEASWTLYWAVTASALALALAAGLATVVGRLPPSIGLVITAALLLTGLVGCHPLPDRLLRRRVRPVLQRGFELTQRGRSQEAIAAYDEFLARWGLSR